MKKNIEITDKIFECDELNFESVAIDIFQFQYQNNNIYQEFCIALQKSPDNVKSLEDIPFLPISFFKNHKIVSSEKSASQIFESSTTTGNIPSKHFVIDIHLYEKSFETFFLQQYPNLKDSALLALLPNYIERGQSSLVYMVNHLMQKAMTGDFYLYDFEKLYTKILEAHAAGIPVILIGVSFALLDFADKYRLPDDIAITIIETGGMKGRKEEITRTQLHSYLKEKLNVSAIHSEYGMTELFSQAYAKENEQFITPNWMKIKIRDLQDPFSFLPDGKVGGINVIDLANLYSCSFIATEDLGKINKNNTFEVLGRIENSAIRGCNLLYV